MDGLLRLWTWASPTARTCELGVGLGLQCEQVVETNHPRGVMEVLLACSRAPPSYLGPKQLLMKEQ
jgi:hypothetical protein